MMGVQNFLRIIFQVFDCIDSLLESVIVSLQSFFQWGAPYFFEFQFCTVSSRNFHRVVFS